MSTSAVYDAFKARLIDQLGSTWPIIDWEEIQATLQQSTSPWIAIEDSGAQEELTSIGTPYANWVEDNGFMDFSIFVPSSGSLSAARTVAESVRDALRFYHFTGLPAGETLRVTAVSTPNPGVIQDGLWHSMMITADYTHRYAARTAAE